MRRILTALAFVLVALPAWSQSARPPRRHWPKEPSKPRRSGRRDARAAPLPPAKSFGDDDLKGGGSKATVFLVGDVRRRRPLPRRATAKADKAAKTDDQARAERRDVIQKQLVEEQKRIDLIEKTMADAQRELGDITNYTYGEPARVPAEVPRRRRGRADQGPREGEQPGGGGAQARRVGLAIEIAVPFVGGSRRCAFPPDRGRSRPRPCCSR